MSPDLTCAVLHHVDQVRVHNAMIAKQHESELPQSRQGDDTLVIVLWEITYKVARTKIQTACLQLDVRCFTVRQYRHISE